MIHIAMHAMYVASHCNNTIFCTHKGGSANDNHLFSNSGGSGGDKALGVLVLIGLLLIVGKKLKIFK